MALKNWNKFPSIKAIGQKGKNVNLAWVKKNKSEILYLNEYLIGGSYPDFRKFTSATDWIVKSTKGEYQPFNDRESALKFAKSYMRSN